MVDSLCWACEDKTDPTQMAGEFLFMAGGCVLSHIAQGTDLRQRHLKFVLSPTSGEDGKPSPGAAGVRGDRALSLKVLSGDCFGL